MSTYERRFTFRPGAGGVLTAEMQDFCHHVRVVLTHDGTRVTAVETEGIRLPWSTCPVGIEGVRGIVGLTVPEARDVRNWTTGPTENCTHAGDLALVALAHTGDTAPLTYEITVTPASGPLRTARLEADGRLVLEWTVAGNTLTGPGEWAGRTLSRSDFLTWSARLEPPLAEAATLLRRACHIAPSRDVDLDRLAVAAESIPPSNSCHTLQPGVIEVARRRRGASRARLR